MVDEARPKALYLLIAPVMLGTEFHLLRGFLFFIFIQTDSLTMYVRKLYWAFSNLSQSGQNGGKPKTPCAKTLGH